MKVLDLQSISLWPTCGSHIISRNYSSVVWETKGIPVETYDFILRLVLAGGRHEGAMSPSEKLA